MRHLRLRAADETVRRKYDNRNVGDDDGGGNEDDIIIIILIIIIIIIIKIIKIQY